MATGPTVRQRELGKRLRELRNQHGLSVEDVAEKLLCSTTKISRLEEGVQRLSIRDVRDFCELYRVDESTSDELMSLARGARDQVWWTQYTDLKLDPLLELEQAATSITSYTMYYIPALLQTEEYTRAIIKAIAPKMDPEIYRQRVEVRTRRQHLVLEKDNRPRYRVVMDEAVLRRQVGGSVVMAAQLDKVLESAKDDKVTFQIVPFDIGAHAAQDSNFILFEFEENTNQSPVVFVEGLTGNQYLEKPSDIARYWEALDYLRDSALSPRESMQLLAKIREFYVKL